MKEACHVVASLSSLLQKPTDGSRINKLEFMRTTSWFTGTREGEERKGVVRGRVVVRERK